MAVLLDHDALAEFLAAVPPGTRAAFEFRNPSWLVPPIFDLLHAHNAALVQVPIGEEGGFSAVVDVVGMRAIYFDGESGEQVRYEEVPEGGGMAGYRTILVGDRTVGGIMPMVGDDWGDLPSHWMIYFAVADTDAAAARVTELGGAVSVTRRSGRCRS